MLYWHFCYEASDNIFVKLMTFRFRKHIEHMPLLFHAVEILSVLVMKSINENHFQNDMSHTRSSLKIDVRAYVLTGL